MTEMNPSIASERKSVSKRKKDFPYPISVIKTVNLEPTDGKDIIAESNDVFFWIDSSFGDRNSPSQPTFRVEVKLCQVVKDGELPKIFGSLSDNFGKLCLTQSQIIQLVASQHQWFDEDDGFYTFFLFKDDSSNFFVASVSYLHKRGVGIFFDHLSQPQTWNTNRRRRLVVPVISD